MSFSKSGMVLHVHHTGTVRLQQEDCHESDASLGHTVTSRPASTIKCDFGQLCQGGHAVLLGLPTIFLFTDSVSFFFFCFSVLLLANGQSWHMLFLILWSSLCIVSDSSLNHIAAWLPYSRCLRRVNSSITGASSPLLYLPPPSSYWSLLLDTWSLFFKLFKTPIK